MDFIGQKVPKCYISLVCLYLVVYCHPKVLIWSCFSMDWHPIPVKHWGESVCECVCLHECVCSLVLFVVWSPAGTQSVSGCAYCVAIHGDTFPDLNLAFQKNIMDFLERRTFFGVPAPTTQHELVEGIWTHGWLW